MFGLPKALTYLGHLGKIFMTSWMLRDLLGWCSLINIVFLILWFLIFTQAHSRIYRLHSRWFKITENEFDRIHYSGMAIFKVLVFILNIVPYLSLRIIG
uniref:DUF6868 domain-containing protein n=1 Tax=Candidatus Kentrum sp. TUN TaxID=2126343 RepID=A0A451ATL0_9GAMM|nr:MAG: hypothetical protein BECKTUN1418F_GA0071002_12014 [Candidatus Kentron sp. TUN]VFK63556.1 MAG: hypothetical protein BECKTUN1418D_GA0071000_12184 [Candidatus Kentron sp. TUN]VFK69398.1 MAG: hypothetical protein BECKTUN1418E_GA0071001_11955 [Candidatus Kentron sp. TUN]